MEQDSLFSRLTSALTGRKPTTPIDLDSTLEAPRDKRASERVNTYKDTVVYLPNGRTSRGVLRDMSETGARLACVGSTSLPDWIEITAFGQRYKCRVVWRATFEAGLEYCA